MVVTLGTTLARMPFVLQRGHHHGEIKLKKGPFKKDKKRLTLLWASSTKITFFWVLIHATHVESVF